MSYVLTSAVLALLLGFGAGWWYSNSLAETRALREARLASRVRDSLSIELAKRSGLLVTLATEHARGRRLLSDSLDSARRRLRTLMAKPADEQVDTGTVQGLIRSCNYVFNTCEETVGKQQTEIEAQRLQLRDLIAKGQADSAKFEEERRAWRRREATLAMSRAMSTVKTAGLTTLILGAGCYVSHMGKNR